MAPTRMKLRVRQRDAAAAPAGGAALEEEAEGPRQSRRSSRRKANKKGPAPCASSAPSSSASPPTTSSGGARPAVAAEASPDSKCPICLDRFNNLAYLDHCLHRFCFPCIQEWSHNKAECPLCKQPFASILHSVRAEDDFKEYTLQPPPPPPPRAAASQLTASTFLTTVAAMTSDGSTQHHLRLMLRRHLVATDQEAARRRRRREQAASGRRSGDRMGEWEFFMHSPPLPVSPYHLNMSEIIMGDMGVEQQEEEEEERRLDFGEPPGAAAPSSRASRRLMCRLAVRQRLQREGGAAPMRGAELMAFRKALYQCGVRVRGVSGNQGRRRSVTAEAFRRSSAHLNRLHAWLRRELAVLLGSRASLADVVQRAVMARVRRSGLEDPDTIEEELRPFLLGRAAHFVHEMVSFARSSLRMEVYDQQAVYELPPSALELDRLSSSSDGSSVIAISEEEEEAEEERGGRSDGAAGGSHDDVIATGSSLSLSGWDDETPGPSYTSAEPPPPFSPVPQEPANQERGEEEECLIVGYKKPMAERTPELVQLSSDSEEEEGEKKKKEEEEEEVISGPAEKAPPPPPPSCLPIIPASTSGAFRAEAEEQRERDPRRWRSGSWSESSGGSRLSVCSLSPATPEQRRRDRRRRKKKRGRDRSGERPRRSGTFCNPNRSIFPPMMSRRSPSPLRSSADSASSPPRSPRDSSWEFRLSQVSPLSSSVSSPCRSFSPLYSSPPESPPTPSYSPKRPHHADKPGGKRKYKSRHLNSGAKDPPWRPERRRRGGERKKREKPRRRENGSLKTGSRRSREERSPSVEIIYEGTLPSGAEQPSGPKRRRRRHRRTQLTSSPVIITLDSDSSHDDANKKTNSASSSPLSSQQTIDFSDLPPLPLAPSARGTMDADIGDLPADILDRGSDGSECEAVDPSRAKNRRDNSFVDVTNVEETVSLPDSSDDQQTAEPVGAAEPKAPSGGQREPAAVGEGEGSGAGHRGDPEPSSSDRCLLESILNDLNQLAPPRRELALNPDYGFPPEKRRRTLQEASAEAGCYPVGGACSGPAPPISCQQNQDYGSRTSSVPSPPPVERAEGREVPPLLRRTSPVGSYHRNTPPPLKHKDDPQQGAALPRDVRPRRHDCDPTGSSSPLLLGLNNHAIPPISTLKSHLHHLYPPPAGFPAYPHSSEYFPALGFGSFPPTESHPSRGRLKLSSAA
ncbi:E3 ubiquitin-protein ligase Topors isoform X2 [Fundulus heteroclitus]|uniref:E3 ubiquitin-protein ligase Topors isoform X2 n=1 Tax=Fundulus heteroclitus TaxID=8078 RepID=UPI00165BBFBA|nr:E3 ubiquitin-protein ligase Topors isoform X2 [Fundulus heteroclitus]